MQARQHIKESQRLNASVMCSLEILDHLESENSASLTELSDALHINKSRILRLCGTMEKMGYLRRRREDARYVLGARLLSMGRAFERQNPLLQILRPKMEEISAQLNENVTFQIVRDQRRLCLCSVSRPNRQRYLTPEGSEAPLRYGASSKVFLAWGAPELRAKILSEAPYPRYTPATIVTADEMLASIEQTLKLGYALSREERTYGTAALAVPVFGAETELIGSISLPGTTERLSPDFIKKALPVLKEAAQYFRIMTAGAEKTALPKIRRD